MDKSEATRSLHWQAKATIKACRAKRECGCGRVDAQAQAPEGLVR